MKQYIDKLKGILSEEDLTSFEEDLKKTISEEVELRVEAKTLELEEKADEYCEMIIERETETIKENLIKEYDEKLSLLEKDVVEKLDIFLESEISNQISPELLESVAKNKVLEPIVEGIVKIFEENYVAIDTEGNTLVKKLEEQVSDIKKQLDEQIEKNIESNKLLEKVASAKLLSDKTKDLSESQTTKVKKFFESKSFDEIETKIDSFVEMIIEADIKKENLDIVESKSESNNEVETLIESKNDSSKFQDSDMVSANEKAKNEALTIANNLL